MIAALLLTAAAFAGPTGPAPDFSAVDRAVRHGIQRGVYPGAVVVIGTHDRILHSAHFGHYTWNPRSPRPRADSTLWDLASLTKVIAAGAALRMVDQGVLDLDSPVAQYVPEFSGGERDSVTVKMLLLHTSGLPPFLPLYRTATSRAEALAQVTSASLVQRPGKSPIYSDLNGILLGLVLESAAGIPLDSVLMQQVFDPLGMQETMFRPPHSLLARIAPSSFHKGEVIAGVANDQNAQTLGGVSGHAGLFATASDLARFAQTWLRDGLIDDSTTWVKASTVKEFLTGSDFSGSRLLGWDTPDPTHQGTSVFGSMLSSSAYGHTGWTGTEMWVDPERDVFVVFLANRSFDPRARHSLRAMAEVRAAVSDAVAKAVPVGVVSLESCVVGHDSRLTTHDYIPSMIQPDTIRKALRGVIDPELGLNIVDIGLVYEIIVNETADVDADVIVKMTLTSPGCPAGGQIMDDVRNVVSDLEGVDRVEVELVWEPYWTPDKMDPRIKAFMGF